MKTKEYIINEPVIGPEISSGSFFKSMMAATGIPKLETGPQKWVVKMYLRFCLLNIFLKDIAFGVSQSGGQFAIGKKNSAFEVGLASPTVCRFVSAKFRSLWLQIGLYCAFYS